LVDKIWVLVADSGRARLFEASGAKAPLQEQTDLVMPSARLQEQELVSDRPGRSFDSRGEGRHAMEPTTPAKEVESNRFAARIAALLDSGRVAGNYTRLILVAPPAFLGQLRDALSEQVRALVTNELDKDLVRFDVDAIREHLPERL
jgi:protein required for attachment to host cells